MIWEWDSAFCLLGMKVFIWICDWLLSLVSGLGSGLGLINFSFWFKFLFCLSFSFVFWFKFIFLFRLGLIWFGVSGLVFKFSGLVWSFRVWFGVFRFGLEFSGLVWSFQVWFGVFKFGSEFQVWYGVFRFGLDYLMDLSLQWQVPSASQIPEVWPSSTQPAVQPGFPNVHLNISYIIFFFFNWRNVGV